MHCPFLLHLSAQPPLTNVPHSGLLCSVVHDVHNAPKSEALWAQTGVTSMSGRVQHEQEKQVLGEKVCTTMQDLDKTYSKSQNRSWTCRSNSHANFPRHCTTLTTSLPPEQVSPYPIEPPLYQYYCASVTVPILLCQCHCIFPGDCPILEGLGM